MASDMDEIDRKEPYTLNGGESFGAEDTLYVEPANGRFESWTYSDGQRVYMWKSESDQQIEKLAVRHGMKIVRLY